MKVATAARVSVELVGVQLELWCLDCNLSTGVHIWYATTSGGTTTLRDQKVCTECKSRRVEDAEGD